MSVPPPSSSSEEKRVLWEVRQRYHMTAPTTRSTGGRTAPPPRLRPRKKRGRRILLFMAAVLLVAVAAFSYKILAAGNKISTAQRSILGQLSDLLFSSNKVLAGEKEDRINFLLLAVGGEGHKGEELADTIMVASIRPADKAVGLISIPRDLYVQVPNENYFTKINAVHAYGEAKKKDSGPLLLKQKVEEITGQPIHYYGRIDFTAFKHIVDAVGGIDIIIENSFFDYWHKISFPAGTEKMNGERALAYVRARYIEGPEGGDFKRASRQQHVLLALQNKLFSVQTAFDFSAVNSIFNSLADNIRTDMQLWEMKRFYELARHIQGDQVHTAVLTTGPKGVLVGSTEMLGGTPASILKTRTGDYSEIQKIAASIFSREVTIAAQDATEQLPPEATPTADPTIPSTSPAPTTVSEKTTVEIRNGTNVTGLAQKTKTAIEEKGFAVLKIGNAANRSTEKTTVYALNLTKADAAAELSALLNASSDSGVPGGETPSDAALLVILGKDAAL